MVDRERERARCSYINIKGTLSVEIKRNPHNKDNVIIAMTKTTRAARVEFPFYFTPPPAQRTTN